MTSKRNCPVCGRQIPTEIKPNNITGETSVCGGCGQEVEFNPMTIPTKQNIAHAFICKQDGKPCHHANCGEHDPNCYACKVYGMGNFAKNNNYALPSKQNIQERFEKQIQEVEDIYAEKDGYDKLKDFLKSENNKLFKSHPYPETAYELHEGKVLDHLFSTLEEVILYLAGEEKKKITEDFMGRKLKNLSPELQRQASMFQNGSNTKRQNFLNKARELGLIK
jgi:hypothetical protein